MGGEIVLPRSWADFYTFAKDADHALELAGNGAADEYKTFVEALSHSGDKNNEDRKIFHVIVEELPT